MTQEAGNHLRKRKCVLRVSTDRRSPENKQVRPGLKLSLFPGPWRSLEEGQRPLWESGVSADFWGQKQPQCPVCPPLAPRWSMQALGLCSQEGREERGLLPGRLPDTC